MASTPSARSIINRINRENILLWTCPWKTLQYCLLEIYHEFYESAQELCQYKKIVIAVTSTFIYFVVLYFLPGSHSPMIDYASVIFISCVYWIVLGVLSSIGFGTGLPTFVLYLGPLIASVTLAAYECDSVDFPEPPYPDLILCPFSANNRTTNSSNVNLLKTIVLWTGNLLRKSNNKTQNVGTSAVNESTISIWMIMSKVRLECLMWGFGTALGELPPYFMAKAARLSQEDPEDEEDRPFVVRQRTGLENLTLLDRLQMWVEDFILRMGFWGILLLASIPNPLFDLVGIACGHYSVPFLTFFSATLIGKSIIKMHIQAVFVIIMFSEQYFDRCMAGLNSILLIGDKIETYVKAFLNDQKAKLHGNPNNFGDSEDGLLKIMFDLTITATIVYFLVSTINTLAQDYHRRLCLQETENKKVA